eukprot:1909631-Rhodomonas_salina.3
MPGRDPIHHDDSDGQRAWTTGSSGFEDGPSYCEDRERSTGDTAALRATDDSLGGIHAAPQASRGPTHLARDSDRTRQSHGLGPTHHRPRPVMNDTAKTASAPRKHDPASSLPMPGTFQVGSRWCLTPQSCPDATWLGKRRLVVVGFRGGGGTLSWFLLAGCNISHAVTSVLFSLVSLRANAAPFSPPSRSRSAAPGSSFIFPLFPLALASQARVSVEVVQAQSAGKFSTLKRSTQ